MRLQNTLLDKEVLDVYKTSLSSLKSIFNESEMNVDNITTTMLEIGEVYVLTLKMLAWIFGTL